MTNYTKNFYSSTLTLVLEYERIKKKKSKHFKKSPPQNLKNFGVEVKLKVDKKIK